jgi:hypothetical protein
MLLRIASISLICLWATNLHAQPNDGAPATTATEPVAATPEPAATTAEPVATLASRNIGFRNGFSLSAGQESGTTASGADISGQLYGVDWRIGTGINEAISVYLHSHLSMGTASVGGASGATGNFATALVGEYMLPNRLFFGGGAGYGVLNNPSGPLAEVRAGYYPFENSSTAAARRLNVALDARWYFVDDGGTDVTVTHIALSLGYDRF